VVKPVREEVSVLSGFSELRVPGLAPPGFWTPMETKIRSETTGTRILRSGAATMSYRQFGRYSSTGLTIVQGSIGHVAAIPSPA
jgi:hypothetical protein